MRHAPAPHPHPRPGSGDDARAGWYARGTPGVRRRQAAEGAAAQEPVAITEPVNWSLRAAPTGGMVLAYWLFWPISPEREKKDFFSLSL